MLPAYRTGGAHLKSVLVKRMGRYVHSHQFLLLLEKRQAVFFLSHLREFRAHGLHLLNLSEQGCCGIHLVVAVKLRVVHQFVNEHITALSRKEILASLVFEGIQRTSVN